MHMFSIDTLLSAENKASCFPDRVSWISLYIWCQNSFAVSPDGKTIIGVIGTSRETLVTENFSRLCGPSPIHTQPHQISSLVTNKDFTILLVGHENGSAIQYSGHGEFWKVARNFGDVGVETIYASAQLGYTVVLGGKNGKFRMLDIRSRRPVGPARSTKIEMVYSLDLMPGWKGIPLLAISGRSVNDEKYGFDYVDLERLFKKHRLPLPCERSLAASEPKDRAEDARATRADLDSDEKKNRHPAN